MKTLTVIFKSKDDSMQSCNDHTLYYFYLYMLRKTYQIFFIMASSVTFSSVLL